MKHLILVLGFSILICSTTLAQEIEATKIVDKGNRHYNKNRFDKAYQYYLKALTLDSNNVEANLFVGIELLEREHKWKALPYIKKAYDLDKKVNAQIDFYLGMASQYNYEFLDALIYLNKAKSSSENYSNEELQEINLRIQQCKNAIAMEGNSPSYFIENLGERINSAYRDYAPVIDQRSETLLLTSNRNMRGKNNMEYFSDIYLVEKPSDQIHGAIKVDDPINSKYDDIGLSLDNEGSLLIHSNKNNGDIFISYSIDDHWSKPKSISDKINTELYIEGSACLSRQGDFLFFTSDRPGGYGGMDIYVSKRKGDGSWDTPKNLGKRINTAANEEAPYISSNGQILFFSSEGHSGIGGFDIYYSLWDENVWNWCEPRNMGLSVNTPQDDINFVLSDDGIYGYFSATRHDTYGAEDIYQLRMKPELSDTESLLASLFSSPVSRPNSIAGNVQQNLTSNTENINISSHDTELWRNIYFKPDNKSIDTNEVQHLNKIAHYMKENKNVGLEILGHTDDTGSSAYNLHLSKERAGEVFKYLVHKGISPSRMVSLGYGKSIPLATNDDETEGRELNRRVEFNVVPVLDFDLLVIPDKNSYTTINQ